MYWGRGESLWDAIRKKEGRIKDGSPPSLSCDSFSQWRHDIQLLKTLNVFFSSKFSKYSFVFFERNNQETKLPNRFAQQVTHYRFSICWSRVMPDGVTRSPEGMSYYRVLCQELIRSGINPIVQYLIFHRMIFINFSWENSIYVSNFSW